MEAASVGIALVPLWFAVSRFTAAVRFGGMYKEVIDVALSGALFHFVAEEMGVNTYYLTNSHAYQKSFENAYQKHHEHLDNHMDWVRSPGAVFGFHAPGHQGFEGWHAYL
jgi:hypothetical protein